MAKRKKINKSDEETLKHYESYESQPLRPTPGAEEDKSKPTFVKAELKVDTVMSKRKSALINNPPPKKKNK